MKPLLKKNRDNILRIGTNNSMNKTSRYILNGILSFKNFIEKLCLTCKVIVSNIIFRSDNVKTCKSKSVNNHLDALNIDLVYKRNIKRN